MSLNGKGGFSMQLIVGTVLVSALLVMLCNASCYNEERLRMARPRLYNGCVGPDGELHEDNSTWRAEECMECMCNQNIITCCTMVIKPAMYNRTACEPILNKTSCEYHLKTKENYTDPCTIMALM